MTRRYVAPPAPSQCKHLRRQDACSQCARAELPDLLDRIRTAVTSGRETAGLETSGSGTPSYEPINIAAMALLQDVARDRWTDAKVIGFWHRAKVILGDAFAAYTPLVRTTVNENERGKPVQCPRHLPRLTELVRCPGVLQVHRESDPRSIDYAKATVVRCSHDRNHEWFRQGGGYLRLRVELNDVGHVHFTIAELAS